jgi:hypothetical protein
MIKLASLLPVVVMLGAAAAAGAVTVEGASPVTIGKKSAYPVKCGTPLKVTASGPASLVVDVRGHADVMGKPFGVDFTRNERAVSKNTLTLKKSKDAGKGFAGIAQVVLPVPEGSQQYVVGCDAPGELAMSFKLSKKPIKANPAAPEAPIETKSAGAKGADGGKPAEAVAAADGGAPPAEQPAASGGDSSQAYPGLWTHTGF